MLSPRTALLAVLLGSGVWVGSPRSFAQEPTYPAAKGPADAGEPPPVPGTDLSVPAPAGDVVIQSRGPVHEAFARPADMAPPPGPMVAKEPPPAVPEVPPDQKPEGDHVVWIGGYWAWDADRKDFLWVSGVWRKVPPGRKWVPGAWNPVDGGYQWTPGFWAPNAADSLPFLPQPPEPIDNGPSAPAPDENSFYIPGCWLYGQQGYAWRPGYWTECRQGWIWSPPYYAWTPSGYLFVDGYWDYPLEDRGLLFAPVAFGAPLWATPGWTYTPSWCVPPASLYTALFAGPGGGAFFFGNYFGPVWAQRGFRPWIAAGVRSPLFGYYRWAYRAQPGWLAGLNSTFTAGFAGKLTTVQPLAAAGASVRLQRLSAAQVSVAHQQSVRVQQWARLRASQPTARAPFASAGVSAGAVRHVGSTGRPAVHAGAAAAAGTSTTWHGHAAYGAAAGASAHVSTGHSPPAGGAAAHVHASASVGAAASVQHHAPPAHHAPPPAHGKRGHHR